MDILNEVINSMNKEQVRFFKLYASRIFKDETRKDMMLFNHIRKAGSDYEEEKIFTKLYEAKDKNAFYRLKHRLLQDLNKSITIQHFEDDDVISIFHLLALEKFYFDRNNIKTARYFLKKAESKAIAIESFELLDIIYGEFIRLSHEMVSINPETYIQKRKENQRQIVQIREIDDILAAVSYRLKITQNFSSGENPVLSLLQKTADDFSQDKDLKKSSKLRFKMYHAVSQVLLQRRDYKALESYLLSVYKEFTKEKLFSKVNHDTKLQLLTYLVNTLFKNNKLKLSLQYAEKLMEAMQEYGRLYYDKYVFFYYNSLGNNYSGLDQYDKAIEVLEEFKNSDKVKLNPFYEIFVYLNLAVYSFDQKKYHQAIKHLNKLFLLNSYKSTDQSLRFKIAIAELIIRYELKDYDLLEYKIDQVKKDFKELLNVKDQQREKEFIGIIKLMTVTENIHGNKILAARYSAFKSLNTKENKDEEEIILYDKWLEDKFSGSKEK